MFAVGPEEMNPLGIFTPYLFKMLFYHTFSSYTCLGLSEL
jgi:hypothetical protein